MEWILFELGLYIKVKVSGIYNYLYILLPKIYVYKKVYMEWIVAWQLYNIWLQTCSDCESVKFISIEVISIEILIVFYNFEIERIYNV